VAALPGELKPLVRGWSRGADGVWRGRIGEAECFAAAEGMGAAAATRGLGRVVAAAGSLDAVLSLGWAGALTAEVRAPEAFVVGEVIESRTGERTWLGSGPRLVTAERFVPCAEKPLLAERYGAALVDMEAATVARLAAARGIGFLCVKAVSDDAAEELPDFSRFTGADGQLRMAAFLGHVMLRPRYWRALKLLGINSKRAAEGLAARVPECLRGAGLIS
jgi:adenosylhomocysteine nucleosidase